MCPMTGQPDFGTITYHLHAGQAVRRIEVAEALLAALSQQGIFYENVINRLLDDFVKACRPRKLKVVGAFTPRGGITTTVTCVHRSLKVRTYSTLNVVDEPNVRQDFADAVLSELFDVESGGLAEEADAVRREFDAQIPQPAAGAGQHAGFEFLPESEKIQC